MRPFNKKKHETLSEHIKTRNPSQTKDIVTLLIQKDDWVGYPQFTYLGIGPVSTMVSKARKKLKPLGYDIENKMVRGYVNNRAKIYSSFKLVVK